ncbi:MAG: transposase domain-containing protein [Bradymonadales bacterium]|nr:transposase domain-containing protein [Bradymonadales bacterium]
MAGENLAVLQTLIGTCIINERNPLTCLTDVLIQIQDHPMSQIDELLPQHWPYLGTS